MTKLVVAIGGNALQPAGETADAAAQRRRIEATASRLTDLVAAGHDVVLTHGNGPQVGNILLQNEETRHLVPPMPLDVCGAESQALIGYLLEQALRNEFALRKIDRDVACVVTQVLVHADDPAFANPTKPIGPYYLRDDEILVKKAKGWKMVYDQRGGWRRIVPSPRPVDVIEKDIIRTVVGNGEGRLVIAAGGGGIPVIRKDGKLVGVEAVIDKDLAAAVLARAIGWKHLVIATDVPQIALDFGKPSQRFLDHLTISEAKKHLADGQFPPGSMGPNVEAVIEFLEHGGHTAGITGLAHRDPRVGREAYRNAFDAAISMFTSFGYFDRPEEDRQMLRGIARALRPRGKFLMELFNRDSLVARLPSQSWQARDDGTVVLEDASFDLLRGRFETRQVIIDRKGTREFTASVRAYTLPELKEMLDAAGLFVHRVLGGLDLSPYTGRSWRLVLYAVKGSEPEGIRTVW